MAEQRNWRDGPIYWCIVAALISATAFVVASAYWASVSAPRDIAEVNIVETLPLRFGCEPEHRLGLHVIFVRGNDPKEFQALACFDFSKWKWHMQYSGPPR